MLLNILDGMERSNAATLWNLGPSRKLLVYLTSTSSLSCWRWALRLTGKLRASMPKRALVLDSGLSAAFLASLSTASLPGMPACPGVHLTLSLTFGNLFLISLAVACISLKMYSAAVLVLALWCMMA